MSYVRFEINPTCRITQRLTHSHRTSVFRRATLAVTLALTALLFCKSCSHRLLGQQDG